MGDKLRWYIAGAIALFSAISYFGQTVENPVTGEKQHVSMSPQQEVTMGLRSAPQMAAQFGGLSGNSKVASAVKQVGAKLVAQSVAAQSPYAFEFHLLADPRTINAFALPGGLFPARPAR